MTVAAVSLPIERVEGRISRAQGDSLAVEEPLEIRVASRSLSVTMRTPGHDFELAAGFLFAEGIVQSASQIVGLRSDIPNIVEVELSADASLDESSSQRSFIMTSACGLCGKESLESLAVNRCPVVPASDFRVDAGVFYRLPEALRRKQDVFETTGGLHAAALFDAEGEPDSLREDVGRHNAVDKLVGHAVLKFQIPLSNRLMLVSGRASFELVQKASVAGVPILAAVGAPSSLAVNAAERCGMTLIGFLRKGSFNVYSGSGRIKGLE